MVNRRIPDTAKRIALKLDRCDPNVPLKTAEILEICDMSIWTLRRARKRWKQTGNVAKAKAIGRGRPGSLDNADVRYLLSLCRQQPVRFLDEYARLLERFRYNSVSLSIIHRAFKRARLSVKRIQRLARERSPEKIAEFIYRAAEYSPLQLVSIDEMSKDDRTYSRLFGRGAVGQRVDWTIPFVRKRRLSLLAGLALDEGLLHLVLLRDPLLMMSSSVFWRKTCHEPISWSPKRGFDGQCSYSSF
ncbi:hypothetical protein VKT23_013054 [Stygiomarasmius scandens]|uniref:Transposase n=1 Tax=Marasmiellus scandens TaxID=2682957 RepID=A0ABR1J703_9AGAR